MTEFFGEEEALREATRDLVSPVKTDSPGASWQDPIARARGRRRRSAARRRRRVGRARVSSSI
jgi:hypothetical protein